MHPLSVKALLAQDPNEIGDGMDVLAQGWVRSLDAIPRA